MSPRLVLVIGLALGVCAPSLAAAEAVGLTAISLDGETVTALEFDASGRHLVLRESDRARIVSMADGSVVGAIELAARAGAIHVLSSRADERRVLVEGSTPLLYDLEDDARWPLPDEVSSPVSASALSRDGRLYAVLTSPEGDAGAQRLRIVDLEDARLTIDVDLRAAADEPAWWLDHAALAFSADGKRVTVVLSERWTADCGGGDERTRVGRFSVADAEWVDAGNATDETPYFLTRAIVSPSGRWLVACNDHRACATWDLDSDELDPIEIVRVDGRGRHFAGIAAQPGDEQPPAQVYVDRQRGLVLYEAHASADGDHAVILATTAGGEGLSAVWSTATASVVACWDDVRLAAPSPVDATMAAVLTHDGRVELRRLGGPVEELGACSALLPATP